MAEESHKLRKEGFMGEGGGGSYLKTRRWVCKLVDHCMLNGCHTQPFVSTIGGCPSNSVPSLGSHAAFHTRLPRPQRHKVAITMQTMSTTQYRSRQPPDAGRADLVPRGVLHKDQGLDRHEHLQERACIRPLFRPGAAVPCS